MDFVTLGMFIADNIYYETREPNIGLIGGAGSYSIVGARLFRKPPSSQLVGGIVHAGSDFQEVWRTEIESWRTGLKIIDTPRRLTTRGKNSYLGREHRDFEYMTPKIQVDHTMLGKDFLEAKTFHMICSPARCQEIVKGILWRRDNSARANGTKLEKPMFVWEPVPPSMKASELPLVYETLELVDVISPNYEELLSLFGDSLNEERSDKMILKTRCDQLLAKGFGSRRGAVVVRLGAEGCYVAQVARHFQFPAYHQPFMKTNNERRAGREPKILDVTGGGNAFLGGFCIGMLEHDHSHSLTAFEMGAVWGNVAASFAIEQIGLPRLSHQTEEGEELWNGEVVQKRLKEMYDAAASPGFQDIDSERKQ